MRDFNKPQDIPADSNESPKRGVTFSALAWDRGASVYDASRQTDSVYVSCMRQSTSAIPTRVNFCLDAGCGTGLSTSFLTSKCTLVVAVDYSFESLRVLKAKEFHNVFPVQADLRFLPFKESIFDASVCANTLQHFKPDGSQENAVAELRRVTKTDGF